MTLNSMMIFTVKLVLEHNMEVMLFSFDSSRDDYFDLHNEKYTSVVKLDLGLMRFHFNVG